MIKPKKTRIQNARDSVQTARLRPTVRRPFVPFVLSVSASVKNFRKIMERTVTKIAVHRLRSNKNDNSRKATELSQQFLEHL